MTSATHSRNGARASAVPVIVSALAVIVSIGLAVVGGALLSAPVTILEGAVPVVMSEFLWTSVVGYVLTPLVVIGAFVLDRMLQWGGQQRNRDFVTRPGFSTALRWLLVGAFVVMFYHLATLSIRLPEIWGIS